ncbi:family 10 glycosylhydrolase [soil metagenome]
MARFSRRTTAALLAGALALCMNVGFTASAFAADDKKGADSMSPADIPGPMREFRGVWVATVANIDWPSKSNLTTQQQQDEMKAILDKVKSLNMNAVVFQVRPAADALYKSDLEPWSEYLTGTQGKAPEPYYDPLEMWCTEAHKRGIELHCWFNPYRAMHSGAKSQPADTSIVKTHPELAKKLETGYYWLDPAEPEVQKHSLAVIADVVKRYDVDGIHFDDYFYPYPEYNKGKDFPDDASWGRYQAGGGKLSRGDWRRKAVNDFVKDVNETIHATKPWVRFGISPFGIWRPGNPPSVQGFDQYDTLYADAKLWLNEGWVDYYTPQLYWQIKKVPQSFPVLLSWWVEQNKKGRNLWPGVSITAVGGSWTADETLNEIMITRALVPKGPGTVMFSMKSLQKNGGGLGDELLKAVYADQALPPASPWLDNDAPDAPKATLISDNGVRKITWEKQGKEDAFLWVVYRKEGDVWKNVILPPQETSYTVPVPVEESKAPDAPADIAQGKKNADDKKNKTITALAVSAVDKVGKESKRTLVKLE